MPMERRDKSGALIFAPTDSEVQQLQTMKDMKTKTAELDVKIAEVVEMKNQLTELLAQYKGKGIE